MLTDVRQKDAIDFIVRYNGFRQACADVLFVSRKPVPLRIFLFSTKRELNKYCAGVAYTGSDGGDNIIALALVGDPGAPLDPFARDNGLPKVGHSVGGVEMALRLAYQTDVRWQLRCNQGVLPMWVEVGLGQLFATYEASRGRYTLGHDTDLGAYLDFSKWMDWHQFSTIDHAAVSQLDTDDRYQYSAQAWALMHLVCVAEPNEPPHQVAALLSELRATPRPRPDEAVAKVLGFRPEEILKKFETQRRKRPVLKGSFDEKSLRAQVRVQPATEAEVRLVYATLLEAGRRYEEAEAELEKARALAPESLRVKEASVRSAMRRGDRDGARRSLSEAVAAGSENPVLLLMSAKVRLYELAPDHCDHPGAGGASAVNALAEVRRAIQLAPEQGESYVVLGRALLVSEQISEGDLAELAPGAHLPYWGPEVRFLIGELKARLGRLDEGEVDFRSLMSDPNVSAANRQAFQTEHERLAAERSAVR